MTNFINTFQIGYLQITSESPLDQFQIMDLLSVDAPILNHLHISLTNSGFYLLVATILIFTLHILSTNYDKLIGNK